MPSPPDDDVLEALRKLAATGVHRAEAARQCGLTSDAARRLAARHGIVFDPAPPPSREHFRELGQKSGASPLHNQISDDARRRAHRTRKARSA